MEPMRDGVQALLAFSAVVEAGSFSGAARQLGVTRSAVSKQIAALEAALGVQLLARTTRTLSLTDVGTRVLDCCERISADVDRAFEVAHAARHVVAGRVRLTAPLSLGRRYVVPICTELLRTHPELELDLQLTDAYVDVVRERIDLALRVGSSGEGSLVARKLAPARLLVCGSPCYFARHGVPGDPAALSEHSFVLHPNLDPDVQTFRRGRRTVRVELGGRLASSDGPATVAAAVAGAGMLIVPEFEVADEVRAGALRCVLPDWCGRALDVFTVLPTRRHVPTRVRTVEAALRERLADAPWALSG